MPRTRKKTESVLKPDSVLDSSNEPLIEKPVVVTERHRVVREWSENKSVADDDGNDFDDDAEIESAVDDVTELDPIALVAQEMASSQHNWTLRVDRLPEYETTGKSGVGYRKFCGFLPIPSAEWLRDQCYLEEIQTRWARVGECNSFAICIRKGSVIFRYLPICSVEPVPSASIAGLPVDPNGSTINLYGNQQSPADVMKSLLEQVGLAQKLSDAFTPAWVKKLDPTAILQQQPASNPDTSTEGALLRLLNSDNDIVDGLATKLKRLLKGDAGIEEKGPWDAIVAALTSPTLPQTISMLVSQFRAPQPNQSNPVTASQPNDAPPPMPPDVAAYQRLLTVLVNTMRINGDVSTALAALDGFVALFPEHSANVDGLLNAPTEQLLGMLPQFQPQAAEVVGLPHAVEWVEKLKVEYFGSEGNEPLPNS